jgi:hypothetical protein
VERPRDWRFTEETLDLMLEVALSGSPAG